MKKIMNKSNKEEADERSIHQAGEDKTSVITLKPGPTSKSDLMVDDQSLTRCSLINCSFLSLLFVRYGLCSYHNFYFLSASKNVFCVAFQEITCILHLTEDKGQNYMHSLVSKFIFMGST